jgi:hypothetical protein
LDKFQHEEKYTGIDADADVYHLAECNNKQIIASASSLDPL